MTSAEPFASREQYICVLCDNRKWRPKFHKQGFAFVECLTCGVVQLQPQPTSTELAAHYTKRANAGNYEPGTSIERRHVDERLFAYLIQKMAPLRSGRIIDIGCFDGQLLDIAKEHGWETYGLELQGAAAETAAAKHEGRVFSGTVETLDPVEFGVAGSFDVVVASGVIEHLLAPPRLLEVAYECLKPGGILLVQTPNCASFPARLMGRYWPCWAAPEHTFYFSVRTLKALLEKYRYRVIDVHSHWKRLRLGYAIGQLQYFGPELHSLVGWMHRFLPEKLLDARLPMYGGEMVMVARKTQ